MKLPINEIICGDCLEVMKDWPNNCVDLVLTDPPYNLNLDYSNYQGNKTEKDYVKWCEEIFNLVSNISKKVIMTIGTQNIPLWCKIRAPKGIGAWVHKNGVSGGIVSNLSLWEPIMFWGCFQRDSRPTNLFEYNLIRQVTGKSHPCPKQIDLFIDIISHYAKSDDIIFDPFCGSGTTCIAAKMLGRRYIGMDISKKYCEIVRKRLKGVRQTLFEKPKKIVRPTLFKKND